MKKRIFGLLLLIAVMLTLSQNLYAADEQDPIGGRACKKPTIGFRP